MTTTPEALVLADALDEKPDSDGHCRQAAAMLRTQHTEIERKDALLRQAFDALWECEFTVPPAQRKIIQDAIDAITKELQ